MARKRYKPEEIVAKLRRVAAVRFFDAITVCSVLV
jgi:hypothetical protein